MDTQRSADSEYDVDEEGIRFRKSGTNSVSVKANTSECSLETRICTGDEGVKLMLNFLSKHFTPEQMTPLKNEKPETIINAIKTFLKVDKESDVWNHPRFKEFVGAYRAKETLDKFFKPIGPAHTTALLDNFVIDNVLAQWEKLGTTRFKKKFKHIGFQMIDFANYNNEFQKLDIVGLAQQGYQGFGVVINTDTSDGRGKHWFCIYGDLEHKGDQADPYVIEYFNSSGNDPRNAITTWFEQKNHEMIKGETYDGQKRASHFLRFLKANNRRLQSDHHSCGVWSLAYIKFRLLGYPPDYFQSNGISDADMVELRKELFRS